MNPGAWAALSRRLVIGRISPLALAFVLFSISTVIAFVVPLIGRIGDAFDTAIYVSVQESLIALVCAMVIFLVQRRRSLGVETAVMIYLALFAVLQFLVLLLYVLNA